MSKDEAACGAVLLSIAQGLKPGEKPAYSPGFKPLRFAAGSAFINRLLIERDYGPVIKRIGEMPFETCWDYRLKAPIWPIFRSWLSTYYDDKHYQAVQDMAHFAGDRSSVIRELYERSAGREEAYASIILQVHDVRPDFETLFQWATSQERSYVNQKNRQITSSYGHFRDTLAAYHERMDRLQREKEREGD